MTHLVAEDCVEVQVAGQFERLISDSELAAMPPSPRRSPALVARRAHLLGLAPESATPRAYRARLILISLAPAVAYLTYAGVIR